MLQFVQAVIRMRTAQVTYYKFKTQQNLINAKKSELLVDSILSDLEGLFTVQTTEHQQEVMKWLKTLQQVPKQKELFNAAL